MSLLDAVLNKKRAADSGKAEASYRAQRSQWKEYRSLLEKHEKPKPGDADRLVRLMGELGIGADEVKQHAYAVSKFGEYAQIVRKAKGCAKEHLVVKAELEKLAPQFDAMAERIAHLQSRLNYTGFSAAAADAEIELERLRQLNPGLFQ